MLKRIVAIGGEPAVGKTTLMLECIRLWSNAEKPAPFKERLVMGLIFEKQHLIVLGDYSSKDTFSGTDKLSMAVQPQAIEMLKLLAQIPRYDGWTIAFEGDRLFNLKFLNTITQYCEKLQIVILRGNPIEISTRHIKRGDRQSAIWLQGRRSKVNRIAEVMDEEIIVVDHDNNDDTFKISNAIVNNELEALVGEKEENPVRG